MWSNVRSVSCPLQDVMMDEYEVDSSGRPEQSLLVVVKVRRVG